MNLRLGVGASLLIAAVFAVGCGDSDSSESSSGSSTEPSSTSSSTTTAAAPGPSPASCVQAWNESSNSVAQQQVAASVADAGAVVVGSDSGDCVLAVYPAEAPAYDLYRRSGDAFSRDGGGPPGQYIGYTDSIDHEDVVLQSTGLVKPVG